MRSGYFKETIAEQINLTDSAVVRVWLALLIVVLIVAPFYLNPFYLSLLTIMAITAIGVRSSAISIRLRAMASDCPRSSAPTPG